MGIEITNDQMKAVSDYLASGPEAIAALTENPEAVLGKFGVELDADTAKQLVAHLGDRETAAVAQAAIIHADV